MTTSRQIATIFPTSHASLSVDDFALTPAEADEYAVNQLRNSAFNAVYRLWLKREAEGLTKKQLALVLQRDQGWVSRALRGPANWEFKTFARLVRALDGEAEIEVHPNEVPLTGENFNAYRDIELRAHEALVTKTGPGLPPSGSNFGTEKIELRLGGVFYA